MHKEKLLKQLEGVHTLQSVMSVLGVNRLQAIYYVHCLRKAGYVKTARSPSGNRVYSISFENRLGGTSYEELLNKISPVKLAVGVIYRVYGKTPTPESPRFSISLCVLEMSSSPGQKIRMSPASPAWISATNAAVTS